MLGCRFERSLVKLLIYVRLSDSICTTPAATIPKSNESLVKKF